MMILPSLVYIYISAPDSTQDIAYTWEYGNDLRDTHRHFTS